MMRPNHRWFGVDWYLFARDSYNANPYLLNVNIALPFTFRVCFLLYFSFQIWDYYFWDLCLIADSILYQYVFSFHLFLLFVPNRGSCYRSNIRLASHLFCSARWPLFCSFLGYYRSDMLWKCKQNVLRRTCNDASDDWCFFFLYVFAYLNIASSTVFFQVFCCMRLTLLSNWSPQCTTASIWFSSSKIQNCQTY